MTRKERYSFTQCPNAEFAKRHHMEVVKAENGLMLSVRKESR